MRRKYLVKIEDTCVGMFKRVRVFKTGFHGSKKVYQLLFTADGLTLRDAKELIKDLRAGVYPAVVKKPRNYDMEKSCPSCEIGGKDHDLV